MKIKKVGDVVTVSIQGIYTPKEIQEIAGKLLEAAGFDDVEARFLEQDVLLAEKQALIEQLQERLVRTGG